MDNEELPHGISHELFEMICEERDAFETKLKIAMNALKFYADKNCWTDFTIYLKDMRYDIDADREIGGRIAIEALKKIEGSNG